MKSVTIKKTITLCFLVLLSKGNMHAQGFNKEIYKKFVQADSNAVNSGATLLLYQDNTFFNYGILKDIQNQEVYIWYTYGIWNYKNNEYICKTNFETTNHKGIVNEIKYSYKKRVDHRLIENFYEFIKQDYSNYSFISVKNKAVDLSKKIEYINVSVDTTLNN